MPWKGVVAGFGGLTAAFLLIFSVSDGLSFDRLRPAAVTGSEPATELGAPPPADPPTPGESPAPLPEGSGTSELAGVARGSSPSLLGRIAGILPEARFPSSEWALLVVSLERGDTLYARNADLPLAPASNVKILTSAAALHYLGPAFRFATLLLADGPVEDGVLRGDLIVYGTGDPALSDRFHSSRTEVFETFAETLREMGIVRIDGDVVGDGSFFPQAGVPASWSASNFNNAYSAPASALSFNENVVTLRVGPGLVAGASARVGTIPEEADLSVSNHATTVAGRAWPPLTIDRSSFEDPIEVRGAVRVGAPEAWRVIPVGDPARFAASVFRSVLTREGIQVEGGSRSVYHGRGSRLDAEAALMAPRFASPGGDPVRVLAIHRSPPLVELLEVVNKRSNNLYSELILLTLGQVVRSDGTFEGGTQAVLDFLERSVGLDVSRIRLEDGSGLSRENRVRARDLVAVLDYMERSPYGEAFWSTFPEAGNNRELRRMYRSAAAGNLRAKTGTIRRVSALSGIVRTAEGEPLLFSIMGNGVPSTSAFKSVEDRIGIELAGFRRPAVEAGASPDPEAPSG